MELKKYDFATKVSGKWILAGEHAVCRGHPAIIFPIGSKNLWLYYQRSENALSLTCQCDQKEELKQAFWQVHQRATQLLELKPQQLKGHCYLKSTIIAGAGMGASAALCVAVGRWLSYLGLVEKQDLFDFCRQLENLFHTDSSGADIAVALANQGIFFSQKNGAHPIQLNWQPHWYLSHCGQTSKTSSCIQQVKKILENNKNLAKEIDNRMATAVSMAEHALRFNGPQSSTELAAAINLSYHCFQEWGLCDEMMADYRQRLLDAGAIAVKPTGAGGGGYVLSLWRKPPQDFKSLDLIPLNP